MIGTVPSYFLALAPFRLVLSVISKHNPKVVEEYQELSDRITTLIEMNKELKPNRNYPIICAILGIISVPFILIYKIFDSIMSIVQEDTIVWKILFIMMWPFALTSAWIYFPIFHIGVNFGCWALPPDLWP